MDVPKTYRVEITDLENVFRLSATPLPSFGGIYLLCDNLHPNNSTKKVAIKFSDDEGIGYDVFDYKKEVEYINIPGQYPHSIGPALIKNIETIYLDIIEMIKASEVIHNKEMKF